MAAEPALTLTIKEDPPPIPNPWFRKNLSRPRNLVPPALQTMQKPVPIRAL
jgi:hypothetical protein